MRRSIRITSTRYVDLCRSNELIVKTSFCTATALADDAPRVSPSTTPPPRDASSASPRVHSPLPAHQRAPAPAPQASPSSSSSSALSASSSASSLSSSSRQPRTVAEQQRRASVPNAAALSNHFVDRVATSSSASTSNSASAAAWPTLVESVRAPHHAVAADYELAPLIDRLSLGRHVVDQRAAVVGADSSSSSIASSISADADDDDDDLPYMPLSASKVDPNSTGTSEAISLSVNLLHVRIVSLFRSLVLSLCAHFVFWL